MLFIILSIAHATDPPDMSVEITNLSQSPVIDSPIYLIAEVTSTYGLQSVIANINGTETESKTVELDFQGPSGGYNRTKWGGYISLLGWSAGTKTVQVTATNILGTVAVSSVQTVTYNGGPSITQPTSRKHRAAYRHRSHSQLSRVFYTKIRNLLIVLSYHRSHSIHIRRADYNHNNLSYTIQRRDSIYSYMGTYL